MNARRLNLSAALWKTIALCLAVTGLVVTKVCAADTLDVAWPTPNRAFYEGKGIEAYIQPTASGVIESGLYGGTRNDGARFHEGIDLKPLQRDRQGEPIDPIYAVLPGVVRYVNSVPGNSNYGRYIVIEHTDTTPAVYSLYAHLRAIAPGIAAGSQVTRGQVIATMGRSSDTIAIPRDRAHLHLEFGVMLTENFQPWYDWKKFGSKNPHGIWSGMNLMGFDPLDFYKKLRSDSVTGFGSYMARMTPVVRARIAARFVPDYVKRYPSLLTKPIPQDGLVGGWDVVFNETGIPFSWTPLTPMEMLGTTTGQVSITSYDAAVLKQWKCRSLVVVRRGEPTPGRDLQTVLELAFGFR